MTSTEVAVVVIVAVVAVAIVVAGLLWWRHRSLRARFGPEYDRVASGRNNRRSVDRELHARERRHRDLQLRTLDSGTQARYAEAWRGVQTQFVDAPDTAVNAADQLLTELVAERGYPTENYEEQLDQLSVDHARTLSRYRDAHEIYLRHQAGEASTEDLRQALVQYRALFADLLGEQPVGTADREPGSDNSDKAASSKGNRHA